MSEHDYYIRAVHAFNSARKLPVLRRLLSILRKEKNDLLAFEDVKALIKSSSEVYTGLKTVRIDHIVGSEGRYRDFTRDFLPKKYRLSSRWIKIKVAHLRDVGLPAISLYKIGDVYFVRDGNHRVSVARTSGAEYIEAEVVSLDSVVPISRSMSQQDIRREIIRYEKEQFFEQTGLDKLRPRGELEFTASGRYDEALRHIHGHIGFLKTSEYVEVPFEEGMLSWYDRIFHPIITTIKEENILRRFPGRTGADLYVWIVRHWDDLSHKLVKSHTRTNVTREFSSRFGRGLFRRLFDAFKRSKDR